MIDDSTVAELLPPEAVLGVIRQAFLDPISAPPRTATIVEGDDGRTRTLLTMPALRRDGFAAVKVVTVNQGLQMNLASHVLAFEPDGRLIAVIEAHALTARRTAAASVLAAQALGAGGACRLAVLGAGRQARAQLEAFVAAFPIATIAVWARRPEAAEALAGFAGHGSCDLRIAASPGEAVRGSDIVSCATGSVSPLVLSEDAAPGAHIDLVGGFRPDMREADDGLITRATIAIDTEAALFEAGDLVQPIERGLLRPDDLLMLSDLLRGGQCPRRGDLTLFKSVGHAAEDLVVTELLLDRLGLVHRRQSGGASVDTSGGQEGDNHD